MNATITDGALAASGVSARYYAELNELSPPPSPTSFVPLLWTGTHDFVYSNLANANASGFLTMSISQVGGAQQTLNFSSADPPVLGASLAVAYNSFLTSQPELVLDVGISCQTTGAAFGSGASNTAVRVVLAFDQAAFGQFMGGGTYLLDQYFEI